MDFNKNRRACSIKLAKANFKKGGTKCMNSCKKKEKKKFQNFRKRESFWRNSIKNSTTVEHSLSDHLNYSLCWKIFYDCSIG